MTRHTPLSPWNLRCFNGCLALCERIKQTSHYFSFLPSLYDQCLPASSADGADCGVALARRYLLIYGEGRLVIDSLVGGALPFSMSTTSEAFCCFWEAIWRTVDKKEQVRVRVTLEDKRSTVAILLSSSLLLAGVCVPSFLGRSRRAIVPGNGLLCHSSIASWRH